MHSDILKISFRLNTETDGEMSEFALFLLEKAALYDHVVAMGLELRRLTKGADMRFLTYLLEMVVEEAATAPRRTRH